jgi:type III restriction enzyme
MDFLRKRYPGGYKELPDYIAANLNPAFELRPYQINAFRNFITHYENEGCPNPVQTLFHMATGSGKTLIMAGLIIYLYKQGYRNFLFFVHLGTIVKKTEDNFLNAASQKYLFADNIIIDGKSVRINEVRNFQGTNPDAVSICFTTVQGLHGDMSYPKENAPVFDDFADIKTVLIADEAHHLNVETKNGKEKAEAETENRSWESTVRRIFEANDDNVLFEFTATCDLMNPYIRRVYKDKIIFNYPLRTYREEKYSKEVKAIRADISPRDRVLQALMFSQYRLKVFQDNRLNIKPVVLFKAKTIDESKAFEQGFYEMIRTLSGDMLERIAAASPLPDVERMVGYFLSKGVGFDELAQELRDEFNPNRCISANDDKETEARQIILNSLERSDNPYRAVFEVKKLDEGWDVLNLFDIVRLYETVGAKSGKPSVYTVAEAQLVGRGARYCPFVIEDGDEKYKRKYDDDIDNPLRVCEELYYHCIYDRHYINELNTALIASGILPEHKTKISYILKPSFKQSRFYQTGYVFVNGQEEVSHKIAAEILKSFRDKENPVAVTTGKAAIDTLMTEEVSVTAIKTYPNTKTIKDIAGYSYSIVHRALRQIPVFEFNVLQKKFPGLKSIREFILSDEYLGRVSADIESCDETPAPETLFEVCKSILGQIGKALSTIQKTYEGTVEFRKKRVCEVFSDRTLNITDPHDDGIGIPQSETEWDVRLGDAEWFAYNDNFGTSEEKRFVKHFAGYADGLKARYEEIYLVRNERQLAIYPFNRDGRFEPDYFLFLLEKNDTGCKQYQVFVEPKGTGYIKGDQWKEDFLLRIEGDGKVIPPLTIIDDTEYHVRGLPFYNHEKKMGEFTEAFERLLP